MNLYSILKHFPKTWLKTQKRLFYKTSKDSPALVDCGLDMKEKPENALIDPFDTKKRLEEPRVVIIGAGMAGLSCAARLSQKGLNNIVILEANKRPGGRIYSAWLGDSVAELGSHWKPDKYFSTHPVYLLTANEEPPRPGVPGSEHTRGLFSRMVSGTMAYPLIVRSYYKFRQIEEEAAKIYHLGGTTEQGAFINFIGLRIQQELHEFPEDQQHDAAKIMFGMAHMLSARCGDDRAMLCLDELGYFMKMPGGVVRVPLGLGGILAPILRQIPKGAIKYDKPVSSIYWGTAQKSGYRAIACTVNGEEFPAHYIVVTVSLGVLQTTACKLFCPTLPASKIEAFRSLGFDFCNKIYFEFCRPFWFWHKGNLNFKYGPNELSNRTDWSKGITAIEVVPNSKHVMCAWVVGKEAKMMESVSDKDVAEGITDVLRKSTGNDYIPYPTTILRSCWATDPYFLGSYSHECNVKDGSAQKALASPLPGPSEPCPPILLFAGEATVPGHFATVSGARLSGLREAERVLNLTLQYKGLPLPSKTVRCAQVPCCNE